MTDKSNYPSIEEEQLHLCSKWPNCSNLVKTTQVVTMTARSLVELLEVHRRKGGISCNNDCAFAHPEGGCFIDSVVLHRGICPHFQEPDVRDKFDRTDLPGGYNAFIKSLHRPQSDKEHAPRDKQAAEK